MAKAAEKIGTLFVTDGYADDRTGGTIGADNAYAVPVLGPDDPVPAGGTSPLVIVPYAENVLARQAQLKEDNPSRIVAIRLDATPEAAQQICQLARDGAEVINLVFDAHGREHNAEKPRHMRDVLREVHGALVKDGTRDLITIMTSGGIAQAEHVAKAIICGADLVAIDLPLMIALECRLCGECERGEMCPIQVEAAEEDFAVQRIVNMMGAWQNQMLELLGAMGIREVRRLRGETGRCMFFEDLEAATFGRMFGKRKDGV